MISEKNQVITAHGKKPILFDRYYLDDQASKPVVIFCHGYKGFKDWGAWHLVAEAFAKAGYCFVKFNFSHNGGTVDQPIDFPDLEAFANNNFSTELDDLERVITYLNEPSVHLIGHSRGCGIALIKADEDARVESVSSWAGVSDFRARFQEHTPAFEQWKETGITYIENSRTKQQLPHYWQFYEDFLANEERLTISRAVRALKKPQLIVHGDADPTVPVAEARSMHKWNTNSHLEIIEGGDHVFGAKHPWAEPSLPTDLEKVVRLTIDFLP